MVVGRVVYVCGRPAVLGRGEASDPAILKKPVMGIPLEYTIYLWGLVGVLLCWALVQYQAVVGYLLGACGLIVVLYLLGSAVFKLDRVDRDRILAALFLIALPPLFWRSAEHTSELQSLMRISYAV